MAYTFLAAKGYKIGKSLFEEDKLHTAKRILERSEARNISISFPLDHVVADACDLSAIPEITTNANVPEGMMGLDIGPKTQSLFAEKISKAKTIFWNGPMGVFELAQFAKGTFAIAKDIAEGKSTSVVGGGDSVAAIKKSGLADKIGHISTGGGASLEFIEGKKLPGIEALEE
jgi:phosphoglycerate kinase